LHHGHNSELHGCKLKTSRPQQQLAELFGDEFGGRVGRKCLARVSGGKWFWLTCLTELFDKHVWLEDSVGSVWRTCSGSRLLCLLKGNVWDMHVLQD
jgi:hypothetical protein